MIEIFTPTNVRRLALACLVGLIGALVVGCAQTAPPREPVTIAFAFPEDDAEHYEALLLKFSESHPQTTVELRPRTWEDMASLEAGSADVFWVSQNSAAELSQQGKILNLSSLIEQDEAFQLSTFYPGAVDALSHEGQPWAIPSGVDVVVMYYNRDLFDQYNAPYPQIGWTWDDFLERAVAIRDPDAFVFGYGPRLHLRDAWFFIYQHGGRIFDDLEDPTRVTFDDPLAIEALEWYARLVHDYDVAPSLNQSSRLWGGGSYSIYQGIRLGKVGMWMGGLSERGGLTWPFKWKMGWGMVPLPREAQSATQAWVEGYAISSSTENHDACWEWIAWLSEQVPYRLMPARRSLAESPAYEDVVGTEVALVARASMEHAVIVDVAALGQFERATEAFDDALEDILQGHATPLEAMDEAQRAAR
jgi:ABC-type glycerol-3-phosphate transport system substrate-binding protein